MQMKLIGISVFVLMVATGCSEATVIAGNGASMMVACALLWSTVNMGRGNPK